MKNGYFTLIALFIISTGIAQSLDKKYPQAHFYMMGRVPQTFYFPHDLHMHGTVFKNPTEAYNVDVTLHNLGGKPDGFVLASVFNMLFSAAPAPPYEIGLGYKFKNSHWGAATRVLHYKYYMNDNPTREVSGTINNETYDGSPIPFPFLSGYEHTDGLNMAVFGAEYWNKLWVSKNERHHLDFSAMSGLGIAFPRTDAIVQFPDENILRNNNDFKITGGGLYLEGALNIQLFKYWNIHAYASYASIILHNHYVIVEQQQQLYGNSWLNMFTVGIGTGFNIPFKNKVKVEDDK